MVLDQLVIGQTAVVGARTLLMELRLGPLPASLLLGHASALLCRLGLARARIGLATVLFRHCLPALLQLPLTPAHSCALAHPWQQHDEGYEDDRGAYGNCDYRSR
ncbi:MAG TPA: hypothetical protein VFL87_08050, partial [Thermoleophilaceae bacterium]|nr:hypothetical protein [Thermoleophilaceae bacterium]